MPKLARKRQEIETAERRHEIARMYQQGVTQHAIGQKFGISQPVVSRHLAAIRDEWRKSALVDFNERKALEVAKLDEIERNAWEDYTASRRGKKPGNPQHLDTVLKCVQKRMDIFGLAAPLQVMGGVSLPWLESEPADVESKVIEGEARRIES